MGRSSRGPSRGRARRTIAAVALALPCAPAAHGQEPAPSPSPQPAATTARLGGYVEVFYGFNFGEPGNRITNFRGFDDRHATWTLSNVALDGAFESGQVSGRLVLQVGHTPNTYYLAEPVSEGSAGAGRSAAPDWKMVQQAFLSWKAPVGRGLTTEAGLFLSPIGPESMAVKDDWQYSRAGTFFALPFYHTGFRATYPVSDRLALTAAMCNGWNSVNDNNSSPSLSFQALWTTPRLTASGLYFGGVERSAGAPEGEPWRHLFDAHVTWAAAPRVDVQANVDAGFEDGRLGRSSWLAGAVAARVRARDWLYVVARADVVDETRGRNGLGEASPILFPVDRVWSVTTTLDARPQERLSIRLEYRRDSASAALYFRGAVAGTGSADDPFVPTARSQSTLTLGLVAWF